MGFGTSGVWGQTRRGSAVEPFLAMDVMTAAARLEAQGRDIVHMEVGQPGAPAPAPVLDAARRALSDGRFGYTEALGRRDLREAIAAHYARTYGIEVPVSRIMATNGSSGGFNLAFLGLFDRGARIALGRPSYPAYRNILAALELEAVEIETGPATRYALTPDLLEEEHARAPLAGILVASPANPTGTMVEPGLLSALVRFADERGIAFVSDEIYHGLVYGGVGQETALRFSERAIVVNSFSKYYCMTGWRVGWLVLPEALVRPLERLSQSLYISVNDLSQRAAVHAFEAEAELKAVREGYARNRAALVSALPRLGFKDVAPIDGAFYAYADVSPFGADSAFFAARMLEEAGVAATPGTDFDRVHGRAMLRFSFAGSEERVGEGLDRLARWLG